MKTHKQKAEEMHSNITFKIEERKDYIGMINNVLGHTLASGNTFELRKELMDRRKIVESELYLLENINHDFKNLLKEDETIQSDTTSRPLGAKPSPNCNPDDIIGGI